MHFNNRTFSLKNPVENRFLIPPPHNHHHKKTQIHRTIPLEKFLDFYIRACAFFFLSTVILFFDQRPRQSSLFFKILIKLLSVVKLIIVFKQSSILWEFLQMAMKSSATGVRAGMYDDTTAGRIIWLLAGFLRLAHCSPCLKY